ncbi:MAG: BolA family protein [Alphaproteobacteria bacterium]
MGEVGNRITETLNETFKPSMLEVVDESDQHKGHAGSREGGESHFRVRIVAAAFAGLSRVDTHREINRVLASELAGPVHALAIEAKPA